MMHLPTTTRSRCLRCLPITVVLAVVALLAIFPVQDFDIFWHLANGRAMVEQGRIINQEIFSFTANGKSFSNHAWLAQIIFFLVFKGLGANGLIALKVLITTLIGLGLYRVGRREGLAPVPAALIWLLAFAASRSRFVERPDLFSLLFLALLGAILFSYRGHRGSTRSLCVLPLMMGMWDLMHGALYGTIFLAAFMAGETITYLLPARLGGALLPAMPKERFKTLWLLVGVTAAVMLVSPYGLRTYEIFYEFMNNNLMTSMTAEFQPIRLNEHPWFWLLLLVSGSSILARGRRLDLTTLCLFIPFAGMAIRYVRGIGPFSVVAALVLAVNLPAILSALAASPERQRRQEFLSVLLLIIGLIVALGYKFAPTPRYDSLGLGVSADGFPVGSARFIKAAHLSGNMYNTDRYGGYLAYTLFPERKIFHYNHHMLFNALERYVHEPETRAQWRINYAVVGRSDEWDMFAKDGFVPVYWEPTGAVMVKETAANRPIIERYAIRYFSPVMPKEEFFKLAQNPAIMPVLAREISDYLAQRQDGEKTRILVEMLAHQTLVAPKTSIELLSRAERYNSQEPRLAAVLGTLCYQQGENEQAALYLNQALTLDPKQVEALFSLAFLLYDQQKFQAAADHFQRILAIVPRHPDTIYGLGLALNQLGRTQEARRSFQAYLDLVPEGPWVEKARNFLAAPPDGS